MVGYIFHNAALKCAALFTMQDEEDNGQLQVIHLW
jgi:hypothetical protein